MSRAKNQLKNLAETKTKLAEKYDRLAKLASSKPKKVKFQRQAANFRHQTEMLKIKAG